VTSSKSCIGVLPRSMMHRFTDHKASDGKLPTSVDEHDGPTNRAPCSCSARLGFTTIDQPDRLKMLILHRTPCCLGLSRQGSAQVPWVSCRGRHSNPSPFLMKILTSTMTWLKIQGICREKTSLVLEAQSYWSSENKAPLLELQSGGILR